MTTPKSFTHRVYIDKFPEFDIDKINDYQELPEEYGFDDFCSTFMPYCLKQGNEVIPMIGCSLLKDEKGYYIEWLGVDTSRFYH
jgi:hypothetical protein